MTSRGWWCLVAFATLTLVGTWRSQTLLAVSGLTLLLWLAWEWFYFSLRLRWLWPHLRVERQIRDPRGPVTTLWQTRDYEVIATLHLDYTGRFPFLAIADPVPFGVRHKSGLTVDEGELSREQSRSVHYQITCPLPGVARFEGLRVEISDLQGFFSYIGFVRAPLELRILPGVLLHRAGGATTKRHNELLPPGIHRLKQPGSGSELLDLRDYIPGDPPRTIAWKVTARRDKLVTKEFESEVPIRCTLLIDTSSSVRIASPALGDTLSEPVYFTPLDRIIELAAGIIRTNSSLRDLTGVILFDEEKVRIVRPNRGPHHVNELMQLLSEAAALGPVAPRADVEPMLPLAYSFAQEVYPDLLRPEVNSMPIWLNWLVGIPRYTRHRRSLFAALHRSKRTILLWGTALIPLGLFVVNVLAALFGDVPEWARSFLGSLLFLGGPLVIFGAWLLFLVSLLFSPRQRRLARWRKQLAALFCVLPPSKPLPTTVAVGFHGALDLLLEHDDLFSMQVQRFLAEHQVPCAVPLYDERGRYLFAVPEKIDVLSRALLQAVHRGRDNELFVLLADLLELDEQLDPLLQAVRVALGRHHQVMLLCPWPYDVPLPHPDQPRRTSKEANVSDMVHSLSQQRLHVAYQRIRRAFARLGVTVLCAQAEESLSLVLERMERLRSARISAGVRP